MDARCRGDGPQFGGQTHAAPFSADGRFALNTTAGQPAAGMLSGGDFSLAEGFWGGVEDTYRLYLPLVLKD